MNKNTSALAIVFAVIFSIILFPVIFGVSVGSGVVFSLESLVAPGREDEIYQSLKENGAIDWAYDTFTAELDTELEKAITENIPKEIDADYTEIGLNAWELFPKDRFETIVTDVYHAVLNGQKYQFDFSYQKYVLETKLNAFFDTVVTAEIETTVNETVEAEIREEYGIAFDLLPKAEQDRIIAMAQEEAREKAMKEARTVFDTEVMASIETEIAFLETELSETVNSIYSMPEYQELKEIETEYGYSFTDRTEICGYLSTAGYTLLGVTAFFIVLLLLCHLFRPSGFITAGIFTLIDGGILFVAAKLCRAPLTELVQNELSQEVASQEIPKFILPLIEEVFGWAMVGFEKVGKISLMAAVVLILLGILLIVLRKNKMEAEQTTAVEMQ